MAVTEYGCIAEGNQALHIALPADAAHGRGQYIIVLEGATPTVMCIADYLTFEAILECMTRLADALASFTGERYESSLPANPARLRLGCMVDAASMAVVSRDGGGEWQIEIDVVWVGPASEWRWQHNLSVPTEHGYRVLQTTRNLQELRDLGRLFQRVRAMTFEPVMSSAADEWVVPPPLSFYMDDLDRLAIPGRLSRAIDHIRERSPEGLVRFWNPSLQAKWPPPKAVCDNCSKFFYHEADETLKKKCYGLPKPRLDGLHYGAARHRDTSCPVVGAPFRTTWRGTWLTGSLMSRV